MDEKNENTIITLVALVFLSISSVMAYCICKVFIWNDTVNVDPRSFWFAELLLTADLLVILGTIFLGGVVLARALGADASRIFSWTKPAI